MSERTHAAHRALITRAAKFSLTYHGDATRVARIGRSGVGIATVGGATAAIRRAERGTSHSSRNASCLLSDTSQSGRPEPRRRPAVLCGDDNHEGVEQNPVGGI